MLDKSILNFVRFYQIALYMGCGILYSHQKWMKVFSFSYNPTNRRYCQTFWILMNIIGKKCYSILIKISSLVNEVAHLLFLQKYFYLIFNELFVSLTSFLLSCWLFSWFLGISIFGKLHFASHKVSLYF